MLHFRPRFRSPITPDTPHGQPFALRDRSLVISGDQHSAADLLHLCLRCAQPFALLDPVSRLSKRPTAIHAVALRLSHHRRTSARSLLSSLRLSMVGSVCPAPTSHAHLLLRGDLRQLPQRAPELHSSGAERVSVSADRAPAQRILVERKRDHRGACSDLCAATCEPRGSDRVRLVGTAESGGRCMRSVGEVVRRSRDLSTFLVLCAGGSVAHVSSTELELHSQHRRYSIAGDRRRSAEASSSAGGAVVRVLFVVATAVVATRAGVSVLLQEQRRGQRGADAELREHRTGPDRHRRVGREIPARMEIDGYLHGQTHTTTAITARACSTTIKILGTSPTFE